MSTNSPIKPSESDSPYQPGGIWRKIVKKPETKGVARDQRLGNRKKEWTRVQFKRNCVSGTYNGDNIPVSYDIPTEIVDTYRFDRTKKNYKKKIPVRRYGTRE